MRLSIPLCVLRLVFVSPAYCAGDAEVDRLIATLSQRWTVRFDEEAAKDPEAGRLREFAVRALETIGQADDIPLLEAVAQSDSLTRKRGGCCAPANEEEFFPVRDAARQVAEALRK